MGSGGARGSSGQAWRAAGAAGGGGGAGGGRRSTRALGAGDWHHPPQLADARLRRQHPAGQAGRRHHHLPVLSCGAQVPPHPPADPPGAPPWCLCRTLLSPSRHPPSPRPMHACAPPNHISFRIACSNLRAGRTADPAPAMESTTIAGRMRTVFSGCAHGAVCAGCSTTSWWTSALWWWWTGGRPTPCTPPGTTPALLAPSATGTPRLRCSRPLPPPAPHTCTCALEIMQRRAAGV